MAKPMIVTLPFVFLVLDYWPFNSFSEMFSIKNSVDEKRVFVKLIIEKIPFFIFSLLSCWVTIAAQHKAIASVEKYPLLPRIANTIVSYTEYLSKTIFPFPLAVFYPYPGIFSIWKVTASLFVFFSISFLAIRRIKERPWLAVGWFWFIGTLVPVIGLVQTGVQGYADRYTYIPLIGLFMMIAWQVPEIVKSWKHKNAVLSVSAVGILSIFWILTLFQIRHWENSITLFEHALKSTSKNNLAHNILGISLAEKGYYDEAIMHYHKAIHIYPSYCDPYFNLGFASYKQGKVQEAITSFLDGIACNPNSAQYHYYLAIFYFELNQIENAILHYEKALKIRPNYIEAMTNLSIALESNGESEKSIALFNEAKRINSDFADSHRIKMEKYFRKKME